MESLKEPGYGRTLGYDFFFFFFKNREAEGLGMPKSMCLSAVSLGLLWLTGTKLIHRAFSSSGRGDQSY